ncbi:MAG: ceramidase domain-containing protein [Betaproteobacteria bacterium]
MPSPQAMTSKEWYVVLTLLVFAAIWLFLPVVPQPQGYHGFADQRQFLGIPNAADVLSNLAFVIVGLLGLLRLHHRTEQRRPPLEPVVRYSLNVFFVGLFLTGFGSAYYHWNPANKTLVWDRLPMTIVFAGLFGAVLAERVSERSGGAILILMMLLGFGSVYYWKATGDLAMYAVIQFGGMAAILLLLSLTAKGDDPFPWWTLIAWYGVAKLLEGGDVLVWNASRELIAGHALKHLTAAIGGLAIAHALRPAPAAVSLRP